MSTGPYLGEGAVIYPTVKVVGAERLWLGDHSTIDDFVFLNCGAGARIGRYVHVATHVSVVGSGGIDIGDCAVVATGARILTATDTFTGGARMSTHLPDDQRHVVVAQVSIGTDAFIGANAVVLPGVTVGEGAVAGAGAIVTSDLEPWTVYVGSPARRQSDRPLPRHPAP